jgi:hypothetical protein
MSKTALYRHFDASGQLLYVGISVSPFNRARQHNRASDWFASVVRIDIEWLDTRQAAEQAKAAAPDVAFVVLDAWRRSLVDEPKPAPLPDMAASARLQHKPTIEPISEQAVEITKMVNIEARRLTSLY